MPVDHKTHEVVSLDSSNSDDKNIDDQPLSPKQKKRDKKKEQVDAKNARDFDSNPPKKSRMISSTPTVNSEVMDKYLRQTPPDQIEIVEFDSRPKWPTEN